MTLNKNINDINREELNMHLLNCKKQLENVKEDLQSFYSNENLLSIIDEDQYKESLYLLNNKLECIKLKMKIIYEELKYIMK